MIQSHSQAKFAHDSPQNKCAEIKFGTKIGTNGNKVGWINEDDMVGFRVQ